MGLPAVADGGAEVFVSYSPADERWATWIAAQLERERYRVLLDAWDRSAGETVDEFVRRGVQTAALTVVVWSATFGRSRSGVAWLGAVQQRRGEHVLVRVDDTPAGVARSGMPELDLVPLTDPAAARAALLERVGATAATPLPPWVPPDGVARRLPLAEPPFPPEWAAEQQRSTSVTVLHVAGPRFGDPSAPAPEFLRDRIAGRAEGLYSGGRAPRPDLIVVSGDLMSSGKPTQMRQAETFLTGLRVRLELPPARLVVVPGPGDVSPELSRAYVESCRAAEREPDWPYFDKFRYFSELLGRLYGDLPEPPFVAAHAWMHVELADLRIAVAGLNSAMAVSHLPEDGHGRLGERQVGYFATKLRKAEERGWLRLGVVRHDPVPARGAEADPTTLHDAGLLEEALGGCLNVLLHGPGTGGTSVARLGGTHVVPAAAPGAFELLHLTAAGVTRYSPADPDGYPVEVQWQAAEATFTSTSDATTRSAPDGPASIEILEPLHDEHRKLLRTVEEVVRTWPGRVRVHLVPTEPPHLLVTVREGEVTRTTTIGAWVGEPTAEVVDAFVSHARPGGGELVYEAAEPPPRELRERARREGVVLKRLVEFQGMVDLGGYVARQRDRLRTDERYPPHLYLPQRYRLRNGHTSGPRPHLDRELLRLATADEGSFAVVLGDFGRGKSFVLREVTLRIPEADPHLIPVLVDLRALEKAPDVRGLIAAHLAMHGEGVINFNAFDYMLHAGRIVLLFDGFDELVARLTYARAVEHLRVLAAAAQGKAKIVVACRAQHFSSHQQVFDAMADLSGVPWCVLEVERFTRADVATYLARRYGDEERAAARLELMSRVGSGELVELAQNPRMLSFVADLDDAALRAAATESKVLSAARVFERILTAWLEHEVERTAGQPGAPVTLLLPDLWRAVEALAVRLWRTGQRQMRLAELDAVAEALSDLAGGRLSLAQTVHAMGSGSLLVRTEEDLFGFIHRSVSDWLVARVIARELAVRERADLLAEQLLSEPAVDFLCDLTPARTCLAWAERVEADPDAGEVERRNAEAVSGRLHAPPGADLRGATLADAELSYRRFDGVDLTGADLRGARLVGANLRGAVLRGARLQGARLDEADLTDADLTSADLGLAGLVRTDLTGARLDGARWHRAAVVHATGLPRAGLPGAALAPGMAVHTELAPARVGVRYGFNGEYGRLPHALAHSPAGDLLAVGGQDGGVLVCDTASGRPVRTLTGHRGRVFALAWGEDVLVSGSRDGTVRVWDPSTGALRQVHDGHRQFAWPVLLDGAGQIVTGDLTGALRVRDAASGQLRHVLDAGRGVVFSAVRCGALVAAGYRRGGVLLWDTGAGTLVAELDAPPGQVFRLAATAAGDLLAAGGEGGALTLWALPSGRRTDLAGHATDRRIYSLAFHPTAPRLASGDTEGVVLLWDTDDRTVVRRCTAHGTTVYAAGFAADGTLATGERAGLVLLRDGTTGEVRHSLTGHAGSVWPFAFHPDGHQLAVTDDQYTLRLWDTATGRCLHELTGHAREVHAVRFSPDGGSLAVTRNDGMVRLWNPATGRLTSRLAGTGGGLERLEWATFAPVGQRLVTVTNGRRLNLWDLAAGRVERHVEVESGPVWAAAFDPTGRVVATANDDDTVRLWWGATGRLLRVLRAHRGRVRSIAFSSDGALLATGCDDNMVRLWNPRTGSLEAELAGHEDRVYAVEFGDGCLASASWDASVRIWDLAGRAVRVVTGHTDRIWTASFAPDGHTLATAGDDLVVRIWDARDGSARHALGGHTGSVWSVAFSPDGTRLASGGADGTTRLWSLGAQVEHHLTLLGLPDGWAAVAPDGRYKLDGAVGEAFWHAVGMRRFEIGELDDHLAEVARLPLDTPF